MLNRSKSHETFFVGARESASNRSAGGGHRTVCEARLEVGLALLKFSYVDMNDASGHSSCFPGGHRADSTTQQRIARFEENFIVVSRHRRDLVTGDLVGMAVPKQTL
jgi:hypothetical protein